MSKPKLILTITVKEKPVKIDVYQEGTEYYGAYYVNNDYHGRTWLTTTIDFVLTAIRQAYFTRFQTELWEVTS